MFEQRASGPGSGPRVDRRAARREATKDEIVEAAWTLARELGLAGLSMRDLAAAVDMRAPSLYQYFESKLAIYDAMFGQGMRQALEVVCAPIETGDPRDALRESGRRIIEFATSDAVRAQLLFQRTIPGFEPSPDSYAPALELNNRVRALLLECGITDPDAMDLWTAAISGLVNQQLANDPGGIRWTRLVDRTVDMFLAEVAPAASSPSKTNPRMPSKTNPRMDV